jgi:uncharacterized protein
MKTLIPHAACALALLLGGCASLARQAVLPGSYLKPPENRISENPRYQLLELQTADGNRFAAQFGAALDPTGQPLAETRSRPTVLFFYGNRMCLAASQGIFEDIRLMGANVLIPEYPGYGMSPGVASEHACYAAADASLRHLSGRSDVDPRRIIAAGFSIGSGPAVEVASREPVAGLILIVPITSVRQIGQDVAPWYLRWAVPSISRHVAFENIAKIPRVTAPTLLIRATRDQVTSSKRSDELAAATQAPLESIEVDTDHDGSWYAGKAHIQRWLRIHFPTDVPADR